jgi:hypothetical protein
MGMGTYASDGLPKWYYEQKEDEHARILLRQKVFQHLDDQADPKELCAALNVDPIFEDEVDDLIEEWIDSKK